MVTGRNIIFYGLALGQFTLSLPLSSLNNFQTMLTLGDGNRFDVHKFLDTEF